MRCPRPPGGSGTSSTPAPMACDFVLLSSALAPQLRALRVAADTRASDHQPVLVALG